MKVPHIPAVECLQNLNILELDETQITSVSKSKDQIISIKKRIIVFFFNKFLKWLNNND